MNRAHGKTWYLKYYFSALALLGTLAMAGTLYLQIREEDQQTLANARIEAEALSQRDLLYLHRTAHLGGDDLRAATGVSFGSSPAGMVPTLAAPAVYLPAGHFTSTRPLVPGDAPDPWEARTLAELRAGADMVASVEHRQGEDFLRVMRPFTFGPACRKCHPAASGAGPAVQAGVSLRIPLAPLRAIGTDHTRASALRFLLLWMVGLAVLVLVYFVLRRQILLTAYSEERRSEAEKSVNFLIYHDPLTRLPNRQLFDDRVKLALAQAERLEQKIAVVQFGLDNFKQVNASFGHAIGDRLLQQIADRLTACLRPDDSVARLGDDRFLLLLPGLRRAEDAAMVLEKARRSLDHAVEIDGHEIFVSASAGIALYPEDGPDSPSLVRSAESALNRAKDQGRSTFQYYTPSMNARAVEQLALDAGLRRALQLDQLEVYYQPQVDAVSDRVVGAEALVRWRHPELGLVSPLEFIPLAEDSGMILEIGRYVLESACAEALRWLRRTGSTLTIAVNLSPRQFDQPDLVEMIEEVLAATGLPPQALEIEITEGTLIRDFDRALANLTDLKVRGVKVAIDDFGTGYSSLSYLTKFPIDRLKIDRSFIAGLESDAGNRMLVRSIIDMSERMGIELLAEGVETSGQKKILLASSCRFMQGFLFGQPVPACEFQTFLSACA